MTENKDLVTLTVDGTEVSVPAGTLIIRAAEQMGTRIPRFCDHPLLKPVAACRQCLVDVGTPAPDGSLRMFPKPQPSCAMTVSPGMVVNTQHTSQAARDAQEGVMEFLLINHPLDCPICDKGGECPLQNQAMTEGRDTSRFTGAKRVYPKPMRLTTQVMLDRERCILCQRCVRFAKEIPGDAFIDLQGRGGGTSPLDDHVFPGEQIGTFDAEVLGFHVSGVSGPERTDLSGPYGKEGLISSVYSGPQRESDKDQVGRTFASYFSGNVIQICPVGALTASSYRFRARPFDLVSTPSVTEHDASGSAIRVDMRRGEIVRRMSGNDPDVNEEWITDKDRFAFTWMHRDRLEYPLVRENGELVTTSWSDALDRVARRLGAARTVGLLPGGRLAFEDAWAWSKFARVTLGTNNIDARWRESSVEEEQFLGAAVAGQGLGVTYEDVQSAGQVLLVALEPEDECGSLFLRLRKGLTAGTVSVATVGPLRSRGSEKLDAQLVAAAPGAEAAAVADLPAELRERLSEGGVILVGERAARTPGLYATTLALAKETGARLAWVPRRSGSRAAVEAGLLPGLLPFGRPATQAAAAELGWPTSPAGLDATGILAGAMSGDVDALVVGGLDSRDWPDPAGALAAIEQVDFVVSLEVRRTDIAELADVVLPVAPAMEKNGTFINWEGRLRPFGQAHSSRAMPDRVVLDMLAKEMGSHLGLSALDDVYREVNPVMVYGGPRLAAPSAPEGAGESALNVARDILARAAEKLSGRGEKPRQQGAPFDLALAFHKPSVDLGRLNDGAEDLLHSARRPVAFVSAETLADLGFAEDQPVRIAGPRGSVVLPIESADVAPGTVWVAECSFGQGVHRDLGECGSTVSVSAVSVPAASGVSQS